MREPVDTLITEIELLEITFSNILLVLGQSSSDASWEGLETELQIREVEETGLEGYGFCTGRLSLTLFQ